MDPIILASSSPRRQDILKMLKIPFRVIMPNIDESSITATGTESIPELIAKEKVTSVIRSLPAGQEIPWVLGADTIISYGSKIFGKPQNQEEAFNYLKTFQGKTHNVITALVLYNGKKHSSTSRICKTKVTFAPMTDEEIQWYVDTGDWHGAAGGYRIQGSASLFITKIDGSYSGVIGLPIYELFDILKEQGYSVLE
ncbi:MAG: Maf family protein [Treponema sp.]|jgi:septum formation protein|nr:Maf family protein [Treponema sp.]